MTICDLCDFLLLSMLLIISLLQGVRLITQFINHVQDEDQRQALLQLVEYHHKLVPDLTKAGLALC